MTRIPTIETREQMAPEGRVAYDLIVKSRGGVRGPFAVLLHSPEFAARASELGAYVRFESKFPTREKEVVILAAAREMDCRFEWAAHVEMARKAGVREEAIAAIRERRAPKGLTHDEALLFAYVQQLVRFHRVDEPTFRAMQERFGLPLLVELTGAIGYYALLACALNAFDVTPEPGADLLPV